MSASQEIRTQLNDTRAAIARLEQAVAERPESSSLKATLLSLQKRQRDLERRLSEYPETTKA
jgi:hypothetical protein